MKQRIRLTEGQLIRINEIVADTVNEYVNENLNNSNVLYHNTSMENLMYIMKDDAMASNYHRGYKNGETHNGICFTRSQKYYPYTNQFVQIEFDANKISKYARGLKLIPYQDPKWKGLDEYEERLVSSNGNPFILQPISQMVKSVNINLDRMISYIEGYYEDTEEYEQALKEAFEKNIFGDKLKIVNGPNGKNIVQFDEALKELDSLNY